MKKIVASVGLVALGASTLPALDIPGITGDPANKPWTVGVALRGFYDDNINTAPNDKDDTFGVEVGPWLRFGMSWPQTQLRFGYNYGFKYYDRRPAGNSDKYDQTHTFNAALDHTFSERVQMSVADSFVIGQEPDVIRSGNSFATFQRESGDNMRNYGTVSAKAQLTPLLALQPAYGNTYYNYDNDNGNASNPSNAGLLNRIEQTITFDTLWTVQPSTAAVLGYQFRDVDYIGDEEIGLYPVTGLPVMSDNRNFRIHYVYVGANHSFSPDLTASFRIGGSYVEYYNDPTGQDTWGPYALGNVSWTYAPDSYAQIGVSHDLSATDVVDPAGNDSVTTSTESTVVYGSVNHKFTPKLRGSVTGQFQNSVFQGGTPNDESENYYLIGLNLTYAFTRIFSGEAGYNYDKLDSDLSNRSFDRNRVYIGVSASY